MMTKEKSILYWHFCRDDKRLGFDDNRQIRIGRTLKIKGIPIPYQHGLHGSKHIIDALEYSQGSIICRVRLGGTVIHYTDKSVGQEWTVIAWCNGEKILHEFACCCAERTLRKAKIKDQRCWNAINAKRRWLAKEISNEELAAARDDAGAAAKGAAWAAAWVVARDAAWDTAWDAARDAAWAAARTAPWADFMAAERKWQNRVLTKMVREEIVL